MSTSLADSRLKALAYWSLVYALALPAGWAVRVMLPEPLGNLAWAGVVYFLVWLPLRLVKPSLVYVSLLSSSFGPLSGFEALFIGLEANLGMIALLLAMLPVLVLGIFLISISIFLVPTLVLYLVKLVRSTPLERRSDFNQFRDWISTGGVQLVKAYGIYLAGAVLGMLIGLLSRRLFGVALDVTAMDTAWQLASSLLIRFGVGALLGAIIYSGVHFQKL